MWWNDFRDGLQDGLSIGEEITNFMLACGLE